MKLVIVIGSLGYGGSERQVVELVRASHPDHARCVVVCLGEDGQLADAVREVGARVIALRLRRVQPIGVLRLARVLRDERPDAVYGFLFWGYTLAMPLAALVAPRARRAAARRSLPDADVPTRRGWLVLRPLVDACTHVVVANSHRVADEWVARYPRLAGRICVVGNGVRMPTAPAARVTDAAVLELVCIANLIRYKGHETLLEALSRLGTGTPPWHLTLVGEGPERERLEREVERLGLDGRVTFAGRRTDVSAVLEAADVAVLASYTEGLPNAVLEAMAHGVPVVATDVGGVRELLSSGAGLVVSPQDAAGLAAAVRRMLDDGNLRRAAGERGSQLARERFSIDRMRDRTLEALSGRRCPAPCATSAWSYVNGGFRTLRR